MPLCTGTPGDIPDIIFTLPYNTDVVSDCAADEFRRRAFLRLGKIVFIFKAVFGVGKAADDFTDQFFLLCRNSLCLPCVINFLHAVAIGNIPD